MGIDPKTDTATQPFLKLTQWKICSCTELGNKIIIKKNRQGDMGHGTCDISLKNSDM